MKRLIFACALAACASTAAANHHGRGNEQLNGFPGMYDVGLGMVTFTGDGYMIIVSNGAKAAVAIYTYKVADNVLTLQDVSPPVFIPDEGKTCEMAKAGTYNIVDFGGGFKLEAKDEPCPTRSGLMTMPEFKDYVRPE